MKNYLTAIPNRYKQLSKEEKAPYVAVMIISFLFGVLASAGLYFLIKFIIR